MVKDLFPLSIKSFAFVLFLFFSMFAHADEKPVIALVIDDICGDAGERSEASLALRHDINLTYSVLSNGSKDCLDSLKNIDWEGSDKMLHMPMEPLGDANPGDGAIMMGDKRASVISKLSNTYKNIPDAIGVNNHMGSAVTAHEQTMKVIIPWITRKKMLFLDSATSQTHSCGFVPYETLCLRNDIFLDHVQTKAEVTKALNRAVAIAKREGRPIIAIAHPHPETTQALKEIIALDTVEFISISSYQRLLNSEQSD